MKKESKTYIKNVMNGRDFLIDFISALIAIGILVMVVLNSIKEGEALYFVHIFVFGAMLTLLNCIKKIRARSSVAILFGIFSVILLIAAIMCYMRI